MQAKVFPCLDDDIARNRKLVTGLPRIGVTLRTHMAFAV
jgi:hypothetical protein